MGNLQHTNHTRYNYKDFFWCNKNKKTILRFIIRGLKVCCLWIKKNPHMANTLGMARQARQSNQSDQVSPVLLALQQYGDYMNEPVYGDITLDMDFQFFSNEQEARYEGLDFFQYHWSDPNAAKVAQINEQLGQAFYVYPTPDGSSTFVVVSMGTSSTQAYDMQQGRLRLWMYETGVGNVKPQELQRLMTDLVQLGKHALLINAIGFGVSRSIPFHLYRFHKKSISILRMPRPATCLWNCLVY